jgi:hypothetical protein
MRDRRAVVIYDDVATQVSPTEGEPNELWLTTGDLTRATRFELKPQGVCRDELCFPLPDSLNEAQFIRNDSGVTLFNLTAFARLMKQPVAREHNPEISAWYFGVRQDQRQELASQQAPDFTLPDINGKMHSLSDFRGKKVFLVTWASW